MSVSTEDRPATERAPADACANCGAPLKDDQEWCLECGTARTVVHGARGWGIPIAMLAGVIAVALVGFAIALIGLSGSANRLAASKIPTSTVTVSHTAVAVPTPLPPIVRTVTKTVAAKPPATTTAATTPATTPTTHSTTPAQPKTAHIANWPPGLGGWTVVLYSSKDRKAAVTASKLFALGLAGIGLLNTDDHPSMPPGYYMVFDGRYPDQAQATAAATKLKAQGQAGAHARMVEPPGGN